MRLKTYTGKTMAAVMERVRKELGPDAIIVNSEQGKKVGGARVTAAYQGEARPAKKSELPTPTPSPATDPSLDDALPEQSTAGEPDRGTERGTERAEDAPLPFDVAELTAIMSHQGIPYDLAMRLQTAATSVNAASLPEALSAALETCFTFQPLGGLSESRPLILIGPPGAGKTVSTAKLAAEATLNKRRVRVISTDLTKSTGVEHLESFAHLMKLGVETAETADELQALLGQSNSNGYGDITLIDTPGLNPFHVDELENMAGMIKAAGAEPIAVMPAGIDPMEAADMAEIFSSMGARRMIATRLDTARRFAGILTAAQAGRLAISGLGRSPYVAQNLESATPLVLARIIAALPQSRSKTRTHRSDNTPNKKRAAQ